MRSACLAMFHWRLQCRLQLKIIDDVRRRSWFWDQKYFDVPVEWVQTCGMGRTYGVGADLWSGSSPVECDVKYII
jgi:hypothetical protein